MEWGEWLFLKRYVGLPKIVVILKHRRAAPQSVSPWEWRKRAEAIEQLKLTDPSSESRVNRRSGLSHPRRHAHLVDLARGPLAARPDPPGLAAPGRLLE